VEGLDLGRHPRDLLAIAADFHAIGPPRHRDRILAEPGAIAFISPACCLDRERGEVEADDPNPEVRPPPVDLPRRRWAFSIRKPGLPAPASAAGRSATAVCHG
jgi:hypothetical protein